MKYLKIITVIAVILALCSALYIQFNIVEGEVYVYQESEITSEIARAMDRADMFYMPLWILMYASIACFFVFTFKLLHSKQTYFGGIKYVIMMTLCILAMFLLFFAFRHIVSAQDYTNLTGEYKYGFIYLITPFVLPWTLIGVVESIKRKNKKSVIVDEESSKEVKILREAFKR